MSARKVTIEEVEAHAKLAKHYADLIHQLVGAAERTAEAKRELENALAWERRVLSELEGAQAELDEEIKKLRTVTHL